ncbi:MAG: hypothetical protein RR280_04230 [Bacteroidaceae bacterium]
MGNLTASLFCEDLAGDSVWGNWVCRHCDDLIEHSYKPAPCKCHPSSTWKYEEVVFLHKETEASGSVDAFMNLATGKLTLVELKIVSPTEFEKLIMPLWEHRVRTQLYLEILRGSDHPMLEMIDTENAKVFYMCRTHGKKVSGRITPFKEFDVPSDVTKAQPYLDKAKRIKLWKETGEYPDPMCTDLDCSHAQACTYREKCAEVGGFAL